MNGRRKYKVTIRVVDHPPSFNSFAGDSHNLLAQQRKTNSASVEREEFFTESKSVYKSCAFLQISDRRHNSSADLHGRHMQARPDDGVTWKKSDEGRNSFAQQGMPSADGEKEIYNCAGAPLRKSKTTSLNIYKLTRSNAVEEIDNCLPEKGEQKTNSRAVEASVQGKLDTFSTTNEHFPPKRPTKNQVLGGQNGFSNHLPIVVLNSVNMDITNFEQDGLSDNKMRNGTDAGVASDVEASRRPPLNREGSACSSDSIITEIEGLTDDEGEMRSCRNDDQGLCNESAEKSNNNWRKIRGMLHWAPFAKNYKKKYPWVQLAGHQGNFKAGEQGTILKKTNDIEKACLSNLMKDVLRPYVPKFIKEVINHEESYLVLQDLLFGFDSPSVMDCKMGIRTFLEDELEQARRKPKLRKDLYQKMVDVDPEAPTEEERKAGGISKPRYMKWREELSSSASLGFRIEGIKKCGEKPNKDFKTTRAREDVCETFRSFVNNDDRIKIKYLQRLKAIRGVLESSSFFRVHEVIGSSLLFVHDNSGHVNVWMIDFAKTSRVDDGFELTHRALWKEGNHEDGYLFGLDNMISIWSDV